jgi:hypothetical protein
VSGPAIIPSAALAKRMGINRKTLWQWSSEDAHLAGCIIRQTRRSTWWSVQRLRDRGFLTKDAPTATAPRQVQAVAS